MTIDAVLPNAHYDATRTMIWRAHVEMPLVAIAGARGKTTVAWMLQAIAEEMSWSVGSWLSSGVYIDGNIQPGELGPWKRVVMGARYGELDWVLQEMAAPTVVGAGLPAQTYPAAILTTICGNDDHCRVSPETSLEMRAFEVLSGAIRPNGIIVANADDALVADFAEAHAAETVLFALHRENPILLNHLERGGRAAWIDRGWIYFGTLSSATPVIEAQEIPASLGGSLLLQVQNALAATAFAMCAGASPAAIDAALTSFLPSPERQPGSCNVYLRNGARVLVDSHVRLWSLRMLLRGIRRWRHRRIVAVSSCFPELPDEDAREAGVMLSGVADAVMLHSNRAGIARVNEIRAGAISSAAASIVLHKESERDALNWLLESLGRDDIGLVIAENPDLTHELLMSAGMFDATERFELDPAAN